VHVVYGLLGLKTHSKLALVVRKEHDGIRRYVHMGTGNYNASTARLYTDIGLLTCRPDLGADVSDLFNFLTGYSRQRNYRKLLVAPVNLREHLTSRIEREIQQQQQQGNGRLIFKMNSLVDPRIIDALYRASQAGVRVDLIVRGMCRLKPGVASLSETISVRSIIGRFLEHSRIYYFHNNGQEEIFLGSADIMERNLDRRVEQIFPLEEPSLLRHVRDCLLETYLRDNTCAWILQPDGSYAKLTPGADEELVNSQHPDVMRFNQGPGEEL
jgi:polyphosphate kinase